MDLSTTYLGLRLTHPLMPGASPLVDDLDTVRALEDAGASAIVMHSIFEEQISGQQGRFAVDPERYLEQVRRVASAVAVPVIGSINGTSAGAWTEYASLIEAAGASAIELNFYYLAADVTESGM